MSGMELGQLRYFVTVARELHFSRAAERIGIDQPGLSRQIQALERVIGARLLWRTTRCIRLTDAGKLFLLEAERLLSVVEAIRQAERSLATKVTPSSPMDAALDAIAFRKELAGGIRRVREA